MSSVYSSIIYIDNCKKKMLLISAAEELTMGGMKFKTFDLGGHKQGKFLIPRLCIHNLFLYFLLLLFGKHVISVIAEQLQMTNYSVYIMSLFRDN